MYTYFFYEQTFSKFFKQGGGLSYFFHILQKKKLLIKKVRVGNKINHNKKQYKKIYIFLFSIILCKIGWFIKSLLSSIIKHREDINFLHVYMLHSNMVALLVFLLLAFNFDSN